MASLEEKAKRKLKRMKDTKLRNRNPYAKVLEESWLKQRIKESKDTYERLSPRELKELLNEVDT
jgi:hypothetical protein